MTLISVRNTHFLSLHLWWSSTVVFCHTSKVFCRPFISNVLALPLVIFNLLYDKLRILMISRSQYQLSFLFKLSHVLLCLFFAILTPAADGFSFFFLRLVLLDNFSDLLPFTFPHMNFYWRWRHQIFLYCNLLVCKSESMIWSLLIWIVLYHSVQILFIS